MTVAVNCNASLTLDNIRAAHAVGEKLRLLSRQSAQLATSPFTDSLRDSRLRSRLVDLQFASEEAKDEQF
jgi:hypothetical protein